jgi:outer membrane protein OmpA-like peptidoglycan-associated protein
MARAVLNRWFAMALAGFALAGCAGNSSLSDLDTASPSGSAFTQQLFRNYSYLAHSFGGGGGSGSFDDVGMATVFDDVSDNDTLAEAFATKALIAARGVDPDPEPSADAESATARARLVTDLAATKDRYPVDAARAQTDYDCWMLNATVEGQRAAADQCRASFNNSIARLERATRPVMAAAPAPSAAPAAPGADYTVYFDFDSWTLTAEDLTTLTNAINAARAGRQSHIAVVGHTDTSGSAAYNQALSLKRANVVVEALVDMGARREAIQASGVGESDLAVPTADGVREPKNRRSVITLLP